MLLPETMRKYMMCAPIDDKEQEGNFRSDIDAQLRKRDMEGFCNNAYHYPNPTAKN